MQENALPMGVSQLLACLQEAGITVDLFDTTFYRWGDKSSMEVRMENLQFPPCDIRYSEGDVRRDLRKKIEDFSPNIIGFSVVEPTFLFSMELLELVKDLVEGKGIKVAVGGVHAIYATETFLDNELVDFICIGEGEEAFVDLCQRIESGSDTRNVEGFWARTKDGVVRNGLRRPVDINNLPILDFTLFGRDFLQKPMMGRTMRTISIELSRGCPYNCTYCGNAWLTKMFAEHGGWFRLKDLDKIHREYKEYIRKYDPEFIYKHSESFLATSMERFMAYMEMYSEYAIPYWVETRPEDVTEEKAEMLARTNCKRVSIGLESGNELFRKKMLNRNYTNQQVKRACAILKDKDISFSMNLMIGFPDETRDMIFDGVELLRSVKPDATSVFLFTPYKGSDLRLLCEDRGMIKPDFIGGDYFQMEYCLKNNSMAEEEVLGLFRTIPLYVQMSESEFPRIKMSEKMNDKGDETFTRLKNEYYQIMGWDPC
jgi:radical SAM superfamily enzyme YgiQ (UPF0313 family)